MYITFYKHMKKLTITELEGQMQGWVSTNKSSLNEGRLKVWDWEWHMSYITNIFTYCLLFISGYLFHEAASLCFRFLKCSYIKEECIFPKQRSINKNIYKHMSRKSNQKVLTYLENTFISSDTSYCTWNILFGFFRWLADTNHSR